MSAYNWTTEPPRRPGLYWAYENLPPEDADVMLVIYESGPLVRWMKHTNTMFRTQDFSHWIFIEMVAPDPPDVR